MKPNGSSVYQTLLEFHRIYGVLYFIIEELLFVYKCHFFDFPGHSAEGVEITCLIFYLFVHVGRIYFGSLGNRAEASIFVILSIAYSVGSILTYAYFFCLQTYVLRIELITNGVGMALWLFELLFILFILLLLFFVLLLFFSLLLIFLLLKDEDIFTFIFTLLELLFLSFSFSVLFGFPKDEVFILILFFGDSSTL